MSPEEAKMTLRCQLRFRLSSFVKIPGFRSPDWLQVHQSFWSTVPRRLALVSGALVLLLDGKATVAGSAVVCAGQQSLPQWLGTAAGTGDFEHVSMLYMGCTNLEKDVQMAFNHQCLSWTVNNSMDGFETARGSPFKSFGHKFQMLLPRAEIWTVEMDAKCRSKWPDVCGMLTTSSCHPYLSVSNNIFSVAYLSSRWLLAVPIKVEEAKSNSPMRFSRKWPAHGWVKLFWYPAAPAG